MMSIRIRTAARSSMAAIGLALASAGVHAAADDLDRQVALRARAFAAAAQAACSAATDASRPSPFELEHEIREAHAAVSKVVVSDETAAAAAPILAALAERIGDLDTVPALSLQMLRNALAHGAGDTARVIEGRAFAVALLQLIDASGDGTTPATAWHPCLVSNEYAFAQQVLGARKVTQQTLLHEGDRHYDKLTLTMADGSTREVFFDITELYRRNAEALIR